MARNHICFIITTVAIIFSSISNTATAFLSPTSTTAIIGRIRGGENNKNTKDHSSFTTSNEQTSIKNNRKSIASVQTKMGSQALVYGTAVATTFGMQGLGFIAAYLLKTEKFYDIFGGINYLLLALLSAILGATGEGSLPWVDDSRKILTTILFCCSRGWLLLFLAWRAHERKGDSRFDEVLGKNGGAPQPLNFLVYWMAQAL